MSDISMYSYPCVSRSMSNHVDSFLILSKERIGKTYGHRIECGLLLHKGRHDHVLDPVGEIDNVEVIGVRDTALVLSPDGRLDRDQPVVRPLSFMDDAPRGSKGGKVVGSKEGPVGKVLYARIVGGLGVEFQLGILGRQLLKGACLQSDPLDGLVESRQS